MLPIASSNFRWVAIDPPMMMARRLRGFAGRGRSGLREGATLRDEKNPRALHRSHCPFQDGLEEQASCRDPGTRPELRLPPSQLETRIVSAAGFRLDHRNLCDLSKGYFATAFLSLSLTWPATQSALCGSLYGTSKNARHSTRLARVKRAPLLVKTRCFF